MNARKSMMYMIMYFFVQLLFSVGVLQELVITNVIAQKLLSGLNLDSFLVLMEADLIVTIAVYISVLNLYGATSLMLRIIHIPDFHEIDNFVFNSLFLSVIMAAVVGLFLNVIIPFKWITLIYPLTVTLAFTTFYTTRYQGKRVTYLPVMTVSLAAAFLIYFSLVNL
ncbi:hypothetical protein [Companilactobacillus versmoldensis]|nr:hypothetical protein [Companilactobacillus versmoldensis]